MNLKEEYTQMVIKYKDVIFKVCYIYAEKEYIDDYYQEVLIQLWRSFPHFRGDAKLSSWIYKISLNTCISFVRKKKRKPISVPLNLEINIYDENFEKKQQLEELYNLINKLNKLEKSVILLWLEERSYDEIAFITGLSRANVATKLHRIKEKLKDMSNQ